MAAESRVTPECPGGDLLPGRLAIARPDRVDRYRWQGILPRRWYEVSELREHSRNPETISLYVDFTWVEVHRHDFELRRPESLEAGELAEVREMFRRKRPQCIATERPTDIVSQLRRPARLKRGHDQLYPGLSTSVWYETWGADGRGGLWLETEQRSFYVVAAHFELASDTVAQPAEPA
jgi:hypothetical protein